MKILRMMLTTTIEEDYLKNKKEIKQLTKILFQMQINACFKEIQQLNRSVKETKPMNNP